MPQDRKLPLYLRIDRIKLSLISGLLLFCASYAMDYIMFWLHIQAAETILNDLAVAVLGASISWFYLSAMRARHEVARVQERLALLTELNYHIRNALTGIGRSAALEDKEERQRLLDEAVHQIDWVLTDLASDLDSSKSPRLFRGEREKA